ncbi:histidine kinase [Niabella sp. CC-SYL272]|uniref:sensor histidine kinase n=1 Tax=Niabella agricola TaxID=2891571 RepID=UPI001F359EFC|nr:two-component regulator propeller domain-containing protein [Niabella agricola]MCF3109281.1 histidine kinase [Niabella agricola]
MRKAKNDNHYVGLLFSLMLICLVATTAASQNLRLAKAFTVNEGLASNLVYSCTEDDKGFLWVATDNGVCRFDGKYFKRYAMAEGVPDMDVLEVLKEKDGTIWINTFKQGPCYYDEASDRFIDPLKNVNIRRDFVRLVLWTRRLEEGGVVFFNTGGELVFKNKKLVPSESRTAYRFFENGKPNWMYAGNINGLKYYAYLKSQNRLDSVLLFEKKEKMRLYEINIQLKSKLYVLRGIEKIYIIQKSSHGNPIHVVEKEIDENPLMIRENGNEINVSTAKGSIYVFDYRTDSLKFKISGNFFANSSFRDKNGDIWVSTMDKGLLLFRKSTLNIIRPLPPPPTRNNFRSVCVDSDGTIYGGNNYGEIIEKPRNGPVRIRSINAKGNTTRVVGLLKSQNKVFVLSEWGCFVDYNRLVRLETSETIRQLKKGVIYNDSIIIVSGVDPKGGLYKINTRTERATRLKVPLLRVSTLAVQGKYIYLGTTEGLLRYDYMLNTLSEVGASTPLKSARILSTTATPDGLIWVATLNNGVFVLKDTQVVYQVSDPRFLNFSVVKLQETDKPGLLWTTTRRGAAYINYSMDQGRFNYTITNLNHEDGVSNNVITDIAYRNDSIYLAAESGIAIIPANISIPRFDIKTYLTDIRVNQKQLPVATSYDLPSSDRTITLTFSGVNLSGYFDHFVYSLNQDSSMPEIVGNTLNLSLDPGRHVLKVRAVNINGLISHHVLTLYFNIRAPYYRSAWFIVVIASLVTGIIFLLLNRLKTLGQKRKYAQKKRIDMERNRITEDLHDDIGSTLSSLKVYSDVAVNMMERDAHKTKYLLEQISINSSKILEDIGDIIWSMRTDRQNMLTVDSRIKNFVSEVLGSREIHYEINIDPEINDIVQHITARKNVVLIVKEAVNNIVKYSKASLVSIRLYAKNDLLRIEIVDNGIGFQEDAKSSGNGLRNMKKRAEELGGVFQIASFLQKGTKISVEIPVTNIRDKGI